MVFSTSIDFSLAVLELIIFSSFFQRRKKHHNRKIEYFFRAVLGSIFEAE